MKGFLRFIREQGVVGLAIGFIMGGAISSVVSAFVDDIVNPLVSAFFKGVDSLAEASFTVGSAQILWGDFVAVMIDFFIIAIVVYLMFKVLHLERLDEKE